MPVQLRTAVPADHELILALMTSVIRASQAAEHQADTIANVTANLAVWRADPQRCVHLVAERDGRIVGVVLVKAFWNLCSLFVATDQQGRGIGTALVQAAVAAFRAQGQEPELCLNAAPNAVGFYAALGFEPRASAQRLPPGFQAMRYRLAAGGG